MAGNGPLPKREGRRNRRPTPGWTQLPPEGREGVPPEWPLPDLTVVEAEVWEDLWSLPQAIMWEDLRLGRTVARYVRFLVEAEKIGADTTLRSEVRQLEDRLGLNPKAMASLRWEIIQPDEEEPDEPGPRESGTRARVRAVDKS